LAAAASIREIARMSVPLMAGDPRSCQG